MKLKNIIFDFDGVIADSYQTVQKLFVEEDPSITKKVLLDSFEGNVSLNLKKELGNRYTPLVKKFLKKYNKKIIGVSAFSGVENSLKKIAKDYRLFIISNGSEKIINTFLEIKGINYFDKILGREVHLRKVVKFKILEKEFGISSDDTIFITDTLGDIIEAHQAGYKVLAETFGFHDKKRLQKGDPEWIVDDWSSLVTIINSL